MCKGSICADICEQRMHRLRRGSLRESAKECHEMEECAYLDQETTRHIFMGCRRTTRARLLPPGCAQLTGRVYKGTSARARANDEQQRSSRAIFVKFGLVDRGSGERIAGIRMGEDTGGVRENGARMRGIVGDT